MADEEDEGGFGGLYEDGHWVWDEETEGLVFVSDLPPKQVEIIQMPTKAPTGTIDFRDDVDLIEQIRFRRRYQRKLKPGQADVITVQDVKDIALFTAPVNILSPVLINMLHLPTTERFIRALVLCCQYYLQIANEMTERIIKLESKVRTPQCEIVESEFRDNLSDLRLLVAKEYSTMLIGFPPRDTKKFHHMGPQKKRRSLSDKDARFFETLLRMCVQIVWLALGRKAFNQIELEVNRMFKSEIFNAVEHTLKTGYISKMVKEERQVLLGKCVRQDKKLNTRSPLMNEVFCHREIDYRMMGLGVIKCQQLNPRILYMLQAVAGPEENLSELGIVLGIIGMPRNVFDTMLRPIPTGGDTSKSRASVSTQSYGSNKSAVSASSRKSQLFMPTLYPNIVLPAKESELTYFPSQFSDETEVIRPCSETQRRRWQNRLQRLLHPH
nr:protein phosphatase 1 regulatory subunit 36-like [Danaus plexippus plexippus]